MKPKDSKKIESLMAEIKSLKFALKPFALMGEITVGYSDLDGNYRNLSVYDFRNAKMAYERKAEQERAK